MKPLRNVSRLGALGCLLTCLAAPVAAQQYPARLDWAQQVTLGSAVSGVLTRVEVKPGQRVKRGQLLLEFDQRLFRSALARAKARLEEARQLRDEALREQERAMELFERTLLSEHERQLADIALTRANAALSSAQADLTEAKVKLEYSRLVAPFDAWVTQVAVNEGETLVNRLEAKTLLRLAAADRMRAVAKVRDAQLSGLSGVTDAVVLVAGRRYEAQLESISLEPVEHTAEGPQYALSVSFAVTGGPLLRPAQEALIEIGD